MDRIEQLYNEIKRLEYKIKQIEIENRDVVGTIEEDEILEENRRKLKKALRNIEDASDELN